SYLDLLHSVKDTTLQAYEHQLYPFDELIETLRLKRDMSRSTLFDVMVLQVNTDVQLSGEGTGSLENVQVRPYGERFNTVSKYDLTFYFREDGDDISMLIEYNSDIFHAATIEGLAAYFKVLLRQMLLAPVKSLDENICHSILLTPAPPVRPATPADSMIASAHQKRLWFIDQFEKNYLYPHSPVYHNLPLLVRWNEQPDIDRLQQAVDDVYNDTDLLRSVVVTENNEPLSLITGADSLIVRTHHTPTPLSETGLAAWCRQIIEAPFDIDQPPLIRFDIVDNGNGYIFIITAHHLIADRKTLRLLYENIWSRYAAHSGAACATPAETGLYTDYVSRQRQMMEDSLAAASFYWKRKMVNAPVLVLDTDFPREHIHVYSYGCEQTLISGELSERINTFAAKYGSTRFLLLLSAFSALMQRYTESESVVLGTLYENRSLPGLKHINGPVANLLALKHDFSAKSSFLEVLTEVTADYTQSVAFSAVPFEQVVLDVNPGKDMSRTALFDVLVHYEDMTEDAGIDILELNMGLGKYDLNLLISLEDNILLTLSYNARYFSAQRMGQLLKHYTALLDAALSAPETAVGKLDYLSSTEKDYLRHVLDNSAVSYPATATVTSLFESQVAATPDNIAVVCGDTRL
ncbi:HxxPF-repeated domain-containing protein, partial [Chitinophaga eiseniae]